MRRTAQHLTNVHCTESSAFPAFPPAHYTGLNHHWDWEMGQRVTGGNAPMNLKCSLPFLLQLITLVVMPCQKTPQILNVNCLATHTYNDQNKVYTIVMDLSFLFRHQHFSVSLNSKNTIALVNFGRKCVFYIVIGLCSMQCALQWPGISDGSVGNDGCQKTLMQRWALRPHLYLVFVLNSGLKL